ncbi:hypothetical protein MKEN_00625600 [Mycena kentingensis (nom. inval.)]|nr:hypothetical protein MKEN_00625600 [Mycena kentingensis (nom. inval.)]
MATSKGKTKSATVVQKAAAKESRLRKQAIADADLVAEGAGPRTRRKSQAQERTEEYLARSSRKRAASQPEPVADNNPKRRREELTPELSPARPASIDESEFHESSIPAATSKRAQSKPKAVTKAKATAAAAAASTLRSARLVADDGDDEMDLSEEDESEEESAEESGDEQEEGGSGDDDYDLVHERPQIVTRSRQGGKPQSGEEEVVQFADDDDDMSDAPPRGRLPLEDAGDSDEEMPVVEPRILRDQRPPGRRPTLMSWTPSPSPSIPSPRSVPRAKSPAASSKPTRRGSWYALTEPERTALRLSAGPPPRLRPLPRLVLVTRPAPVADPSILPEEGFHPLARIAPPAPGREVNLGHQPEPVQVVLRESIAHDLRELVAEDGFPFTPARQAHCQALMERHAATTPGAEHFAARLAADSHPAKLFTTYVRIGPLARKTTNPYADFGSSLYQAYYGEDVRAGNASGSYGIENLNESDKAVAAQALVADDLYVFPVTKDAIPIPNKPHEMYAAPAILNVTRQSYIGDLVSTAPQYFVGTFKPNKRQLPIPMVALAATAVRCALDELQTGKHQKIEFRDGRYETRLPHACQGLGGTPGRRPTGVCLPHAPAV